MRRLSLLGVLAAAVAAVPAAPASATDLPQVVVPCRFTVTSSATTGITGELTAYFFIPEAYGMPLIPKCQLRDASTHADLFTRNPTTYSGMLVVDESRTVRYGSIEVCTSADWVRNPTITGDTGTRHADYGCYTAVA